MEWNEYCADLHQHNSDINTISSVSGDEFKIVPHPSFILVAGLVCLKKGCLILSASMLSADKGIKNQYQKISLTVEKYQ